MTAAMMETKESSRMGTKWCAALSKAHLHIQHYHLEAICRAKGPVTRDNRNIYIFGSCSFMVAVEVTFDLLSSPISKTTDHKMQQNKCCCQCKSIVVRMLCRCADRNSTDTSIACRDGDAAEC